MPIRRTTAHHQRRLRDRRSSTRARRAVGIVPTALVMLLTLSLIVALVRASGEQARLSDSVRARQELVQIAAVRQQAMAATTLAHIELFEFAAADPSASRASFEAVLETWRSTLDSLSESLPHESTTLSTESVARGLADFLAGQSIAVVGVDALTGARTRLMPVQDRLAEAAVQSGLDGSDGSVDDMTALLAVVGFGLDTVVAVEAADRQAPAAWKNFGAVIRTVVASGGVAVLTAGPLTGVTSLEEPHPYLDNLEDRFAETFGASAPHGEFTSMMRHAIDELTRFETAAGELGADPVVAAIAASLGGLDPHLVAAVLRTTNLPGAHADHVDTAGFLAAARDLVEAGRDRANQAAGERLKALGAHAEELARQSDRQMFVAGIVLVLALLVLGLLALIARAAERRARRGAVSDALTGLLNRRGFGDAVEEMRNGSSNWIVLIDLDHFKPVNDTYGHEVGDRALVFAAEVFREVFDPIGGVVARVGGDEFAVVVPDGKASRISGAIAECRRRLERTEAGKRVVRLGCSAGVARHDEDLSLADALAEADLAMYQAKRDGRSRVEFFDTSSRRVLAQFRDGSIGRSLSVRAQFQRRLADGQVVGMELSPVVYGEDGRTVDEGLLHAIAEYSGSKFRLVNATLDAIGRSERPRPPLDCRAWFAIAVADLRGPERVEEFWSEFVLAGWGHVPIGVTLRGARLENFAELEATVERLARFGVAAAVDVTGPDSVPAALLDSLPVRRIVIDAATVAELDGSCVDAASESIAAAVTVAAQVGVEVGAAGVSSGELAETLARLGVDIAQAEASVPWTPEMARTPHRLAAPVASLS